MLLYVKYEVTEEYERVLESKEWVSENSEILNGEKRSIIKVLIRAIKTVGLEVKKDKFCEKILIGENNKNEKKTSDHPINIRRNVDTDVLTKVKKGYRLVSANPLFIELNGLKTVWVKITNDDSVLGKKLFNKEVTP